MQRIPADRLPEAYDLIHDFRLKTESTADPEEIMRFAGCWSDLAKDSYNDLIEDITTRRQQAFRERRIHEASLD